MKCPDPLYNFRSWCSDLFFKQGCNFQRNLICFFCFYWFYLMFYWFFIVNCWKSYEAALFWMILKYKYRWFTWVIFVLYQVLSRGLGKCAIFDGVPYLKGVLSFSISDCKLIWWEVRAVNGGITVVLVVIWSPVLLRKQLSQELNWAKIYVMING